MYKKKAISHFLAQSPQDCKRKMKERKGKAHARHADPEDSVSCPAGGRREQPSRSKSEGAHFQEKPFIEMCDVLYLFRDDKKNAHQPPLKRPGEPGEAQAGAVYRVVGWISVLFSSFCCRSILRSVFEAFKNAAGVIRGLFQRFKNAIAHFQRCLEGSLLTAILPVREILGELIPLAADTESPPLERGRFVGVAGDIALCHIGCMGLYFPNSSSARSVANMTRARRFPQSKYLAVFLDYRNPDKEKNGIAP